MADLLGSILGSMEKPPTIGDEERKKRKENEKRREKLESKQREQIHKFTVQTQKRINDFIKDGTQEKIKFEPMPAVYRAVVHDVAEVAGLISFSFGEEEVDRRIFVWKKEFAPSDDELACYRNGEEWDREKGREMAKQKELDRLQRIADAQKKPEMATSNKHQQKYQHLIGKDAGKDAAKLTTSNTNYGFVPSENKRDARTIEEVLAQNRAKKKLKTTAQEDTTS